MKLVERARHNLQRLRRRLNNTDDVVMISFPKAGRTWLRFMLNDAGVMIDYSHSGAGNRLGLPFESIAGRVSEWTDRRVIFLTRDPRDTVVSAYFQATKRIAAESRYVGDISSFIRHPGYGVEKIARFNLHWLASAGLFRDFMSLAYEDLHASIETELARVIEFATGRPANPARVRRACHAGQFDRMRQLEARLSSADDATRLGGGSLDDAESLKTRRGKVGGWPDYLKGPDGTFATEVLERLDYWKQLARLTDQ